MKSGRKALIRHLRQIELPKVKRLAPGRYLVATTVDLTVGVKEEIAQIFSGFVQSPGDVYGAKEIVALLRKHPDIVRRHIRLWLASSAVLGSLLNRDVLFRSRALVQDIDESLRLFVPHSGHDRARRLLDEKHSCLIAGPPGTGKTTLAHILLADHQVEGFTIVEATNRLGDVHRMWDDEEKQIFFVDDFVGQTILDVSAARTANQELPRLLRAVKNSPTKRLVITCRNYLVKQVREHHERLDARVLDPYECTVDATALTTDVRAEIFYNHVYFSGLEPEQRAQLAQPKVYQLIIGHRNYSPRLLEHAITEVVELPLDEPGNVANVILRNFENPARLWERLIEEVLDADALALVLTLYTANRSADHERLRDAWRAHVDLSVTSDADRRFRRSLRRLEPVIAKFSEDSNGRVEFSNPSIIDFLHNHLAQNPEIIDTICDSSIFFDQLVTVWEAVGWWDHTGLYNAVIDRANRFRDAVVRIRNPGALLGEFRNDHEEAEVRLVLALGEFGEAAGLAEAGERILVEFDGSASPSVSTLHLLTKSVATSSVPEWRIYTRSFVQQTYSAAFADIQVWDDIKRFLSIIDDLIRFCPELAEAANQKLEDVKLGMAIDELAKWADVEHETDIEDKTLEEILGFIEAKDHGLNEEYDRACEYLGREPESCNSMLAQSPLTSEHNPQRVELMFSTFREE